MEYSSEKEHNPSTEKIETVRKKRKTANFFRITSKIYASNRLYMTAGILQIVLGSTTVFLAMAGHIIPLWLATSVSIIGSLTTMTGLFMVYDLLKSANAMENIVKDAINRVINSQN